MILARATLPPFRKRPIGGALRRSSTMPTAPAAPATPNTPSPADTATTLYTLLSWAASGQAWADLYLGTSASPALLVAGVVGFSYVPTLLPGTTYYWKIVASNAGGSTTGPIWSFTTPAATTVIFTLAGVDVTTRVRWGSCTIHDALNAAPNTADLTIATTAPTVGQAVQIGLGSLDATALLFGGTVQEVGHQIVDTPDSPLWPVTLIDYTFTLNKRRPFGTWTSVSATTIAQYLVATYAPGFTTAGIQAGLPAVSITFDGSEDFMTCLGRLATAISNATNAGVADVDYSQGVHLFLTEATTAPDPLDAAHPPLNDPPATFATDLSQIRSRELGKGHGEQLLADVAVGETILPIADGVMYGTVGGSGEVVVSTTPDGAQSERCTYSGVQQGGAASLVGPGVFPSVGPSLAAAAGAGLGTGVYGYAFTDVTAGGESLPSPTTSITTGVVQAPPTVALSVALQEPGTPGFIDAGDHDYQYTWTTAVGETTPGPASNTVTTTASHSLTLVSGIPTWPVGVTGLKVYRRFNGAGTYKLDKTITNPVLTAYGDGTTNAALGAAAPSSDSTAAFRVAVSGIAIGPTSAPAVTSRKIYRTAVNGSQLKLLATLADNVTTIYGTDSAADATLGANVPVADTSGLISVYGQVNAGSTSVIMTSPAPWSASGGWVTFVDGQLVRYTGLSGNTLIGIPASGVGALVNTVFYGDVAVVAPALTGINANNGVAKALQAGASINIFVQRDDLVAQAALGLLELDTAGVATDGIHEATIIDERRGEASLIAACDADLALFARPLVSATYTTRDPKTKSGKTVSIDLHATFFDPAFYDPAFYGGPLYGLAGDFTIQSVDITFDGPLLYPRYRVQASSVAFTLTDLLRRVLIRQ